MMTNVFVFLVTNIYENVVFPLLVTLMVNNQHACIQDGV